MQMQLPDTTLRFRRRIIRRYAPARCNPSSDNLASPARNSSRETPDANRRGSHEHGRRNTLRYSALRGLESTGCEAADAVMIGDDVDSDVNGAIAAGLRAILVRTGKYRPGDESRLKPEGVVVQDIGAAATWSAAHPR